MTISVTDTALDIERKAIQGCASRSYLRSRLAWTYCSLFVVSLTVFYIFWCTNCLQNFLLSHIELRNGSRSFDWWQRPPVTLTYKIYIFNYTNWDDFDNGKAKKLRVEEVGPYIYRETMNRVNVDLDEENGMVSYQEKRSFEWMDGKSEKDIVLVPNVLLMSSSAFVRDMNFAAQIGLTTILSTFQEKAYIKEKVSGYLWGYENAFFEMVKTFMHNIPVEKFGLMAMKNGVDKDRITIHTGTRGMHNLGVIERVKGKNRKDIWDNERCNRIEGTDGSMFPPHLMKNKNDTLQVYFKEMCRNIPFRYVEQVNTYGMHAYRYKLSHDAFNFSLSENQCYCSKVNGSKVCPPSGMFNLSACLNDVPFLISFPHFYMADESLLEQIDGLNPRQEDHEGYIDIHPRLPIPIAGCSRLQFNLEVRKAIGVPFLGKLKDGAILPLLWVDISLNDISDELLDLFYLTYFTVDTVETIVRWGSLLVMVLSLGALITYLKKRRMEEVLQKNTLNGNRILQLP